MGYGLWVMGVEAPGFVSFFLNVFVKILPRKRSYYLFRAVVFTKEIHIEYINKLRLSYVVRLR